MAVLLVERLRMLSYAVLRLLLSHRHHLLTVCRPAAVAAAFAVIFIITVVEADVCRLHATQQTIEDGLR
eukprot:scaffold134716_cov31-Tisochrysis_lutea.AAC.4